MLSHLGGGAGRGDGVREEGWKEGRREEEQRQRGKQGILRTKRRNMTTDKTRRGVSIYLGFCGRYGMKRVGGVRSSSSSSNKGEAFGKPGRDLGF